MLSLSSCSYLRYIALMFACCFVLGSTAHAKPSWKNDGTHDPGTKGSKGGGKKNSSSVQIVIEQHPLSQIVVSGQTVSFVVVASESSGAELSFQWYQNGQEIAGATQAGYTIASASMDATGSYHARVRASGTSVDTHSASLTVEEPEPPISEPDIVISLQPVSQSVPMLTDVTLNVSAQGSGALSYQWRKNGMPMGGEVKSYLMLAQVDETDAATYDVRISNDTGSVMSAAAQISVSPLANVQLSWDTPVQREDGTVLLPEEIDSYRIYVLYADNGSATELDVPASQNSVTLEDLIAGSYVFEIATRDTAGALGRKSTPLQILVN